MSTVLQKELAREIVANTRAKVKKNKRELLVSSGYAEKSATSVPNKIIEQKGVQKELEVLGFTEDRAKEVVSEILNDDSVEPSDRLRAAKEVFLVHGSYAPEKSVRVNVDINELQDQITKQIAEFRGIQRS